MKRKYRFGIVGPGMIAEFHAQAIHAMPNAELVGACGRSIDKTRTFCEEFNCEPYTDLAELLEQELDFLTIATPSGSHLEPVFAAAKAGVNVIVEKPLEVTLERVDTMLEECRAAGVRQFGILPRRFNESTALLKHAIDEGHFGKIALGDAYVKWWRSQEYYDSGNWRGTWAQDGGGALMNQSIHAIDLLLYLMGPVKAVCAFTELVAHERIEVEDVAVAILEFENGAHGVIQGSTACYSDSGHPAQIQICGDGGSVFMIDNVFTVWEFRDGFLPEEISRLRNPQKGKARGATDPRSIKFDLHQKNFEEAIDSVENNRTSFIEDIEGRHAIALIQAIYESAMKKGQRIEID